MAAKTRSMKVSGLGAGTSLSMMEAGSDAASFDERGEWGQTSSCPEE